MNLAYNPVRILDLPCRMTSEIEVKSRSHLEKNDLADFANSVIKKIWIYDSLYVFEGEKSIFDIIPELPCFGDLENPGQLPVQEVLEGTDDCVLWIFEISPLFMFSRVGNPFLIFLLSYHVPVTSKIQVNFRYRRYLKVLMIVSYEFSKCLHYLCFRGWGIHFWYSYWATMFRWPRKSRSTSGTGGTWRYWWLCLMNFRNFSTIYVFEGGESISDISTELPCSGDLENPGQLPVQEVLEGTDDCVLWIFEISSLFMFSRVGNPFLIFLLSYYVRVSPEIQVNFRYRRYWWFCLMNFWNFFSIYVFEVNESIAGIPTELPCLSDLENPGQLPVQEGLRGTDDSVLWIFGISLLVMFSRSRNPLLTFLLSYLFCVTSKTFRAGSWLRFSRSPKRGS